MKKAENTKETVKRDPMLFLAEGMLFGTSAAIERQESSGQMSFVESDTLPRSGNGEYKALLEKWGFEFLGDVEGDPLFQYVKLPAGWKKQASDHAMWSHIVDDRGRERISVFYKAAFYDRDAHYYANSRFGFRHDYDLEKKQGVAVVQILDAGTVIRTTTPLKLPAERDHAFFKVWDDADKFATEWMKANYPDYRQPGAYWD